MIVDASNSVTFPSTIIEWKVNNVPTNELTTLTGNISLVDGDILRLQVSGNKNSTFYEFTIPTLNCLVTYSNGVLNMDFTGTILPNNQSNNVDLIKIHLTLTQGTTQLKLSNNFQITQFNANPLFQWDLSSENFNLNSHFNISFYIVEYHWKLNAYGFGSVASPTIINKTIIPRE